ncbi:MAG TPA: biotin attachment protein [Flavobacteriaceae bacterium]|jgi:multidrug efflux pump subunit AcrA (membrane-fusion protein)|nr:biotin attachment protein [Flavobacteriaceae bacterium]
MLNITKNNISDKINLEDFNSFKLLKKRRVKKISKFLLGGFVLSTLIILFLPWSQNINAKGFVTTRLPEQRPQAIQSVIGGRLEKWFVSEGDFVKKGDTIVFLSDVKSEYFDPNLLARTTEQFQAKSQSVQSYEQKVNALNNQYSALLGALSLKRKQIKNKIQQAHNKVKIDSIDLLAFKTNLKIAENQLFRTKTLYEKGLKTLTQLQEKELKLQASEAKVNVQQKKLYNQKNSLVNLNIEAMVVGREYADKLAKSQSDMQTALSSKFESIAETSKLNNKLSNYNERQKFYYVTAPQSGYVNKSIGKGIGETIKAGADIVTIIPNDYDLAVEVYLKPEDITLVTIGVDVRLRFDGWPAIIISGWPEASTGIFYGKVIVVDKIISENGYYRVLLISDNNEREWPKKLAIGTGSDVFILLNNVPIWYEIWRKLNGFPPDYYRNKTKKIKN